MVSNIATLKQTIGVNMCQCHPMSLYLDIHIILSLPCAVRWVGCVFDFDLLLTNVEIIACREMEVRTKTAPSF